MLKFEQSLRQYSTAGVAIEMHAIYSGKDKQTFTSLEKFRQIDQNGSDAISNIEIIANFHIKVPEVEEHQPYKFRVLLTAVMPSMLKNEFFRMLVDDSEFPTITTTIDYVDYVVARTFISLVDDWERGLPRLKKNLFLRNYFKFRVPLRRVIPTLGFVGGLISSYFVALNALYASATFRDFASWVVLLVGIIGASTWVGRIVASGFEDQSIGYRATTLIVVNAGDRNKQKKYDESRKSVALLTFVQFLMAASAVMLNLAASYIYDLLKYAGYGG